MWKGEVIWGESRKELAYMGVTLEEKVFWKTLNGKECLEMSGQMKFWQAENGGMRWSSIREHKNTGTFRVTEGERKLSHEK